MRKKIVFLPYDFDTAIGINNEGALVFGYNLEDIDTTEGGADVFNGQQSVLWKNMRAAFFDEIGNLETLGQRAFYGCSALTSISIPKVSVISDYSFSGCSVLASADISGATAIKTNVFYYCRQLTEITVPAAVTEIGSYAFTQCTGIKRVVFLGKPNIYSSAFNACTGIEDIYVSWNYNEVSGAPWGAENATIHYLNEGWKDTLLPSGE